MRVINDLFISNLCERDFHADIASSDNANASRLSGPSLPPRPMGDDYDEDFEDYEAGARSVRP